MFARHDVEFIVVGGVAAVLGGAPISTFDLDIVHRRTTENVSRLVDALAEIDARYRDPGGRAVDVLGQIGEGAGYDELLPDTIDGTSDGKQLHVLGLRRLIAEKERMNRDKDRAVLAILRRTLEESG